MKQTCVHCADVLLEPGADSAAPGGAVTLALCGSWDHPDPCRWPHHTSAEWADRQGRVRVVFLAAPEDEARVRTQIERALAGGTCLGPDGKSNHWTATNQSPGVPSEAERAWCDDFRHGAT